MLIVKTHLYRLYDKEGNLIYVGISRDAIKRFVQHVKNWSSLRPPIHGMTFVVYNTRCEAAAEEKRLIELHRPCANSFLNPNKRKYGNVAKTNDTERMARV